MLIQIEPRKKFKMFPLTTLVLATHNPGKIYELKEILPATIMLKNLSDFSSIPPLETGKDFHDNAALKAKLCYEKTHLPSLADDSGLCIEALNGAPGLYSKRFMEDLGGADQTFKTLAQNKEIQANPKASCICVLALALSSQDIRFYEGRCHGMLIFPPRGHHHYGYDPIFKPDGSHMTFAEMSSSEKAQISHRGQALRLFLQESFNN